MTRPRHTTDCAVRLSLQDGELALLCNVARLETDPAFTVALLGEGVESPGLLCQEAATVLKTLALALEQRGRELDDD